MSQEKNLKYEFDDFSFDVKTETLNCGNVPLPLTRKARQVLLILLQNANRTIKKDEIYNQIWADSFVEEANLTQYVYLLRKSLSENSVEENSYIETIPGQGYRFNGEVREVFVAEVIENNAAEKDVAETVKTNGYLKSDGNHRERNFAAESQFDESEIMHEIGGFEPPSVQNSEIENGDLQVTKNRNYLRWLGSAGAVLIIVAAFFFFRFYNSPPPETDKIKSLAVLPFTVIGADAADDKLGLGMADAVITRLSKLQVIPVRPTSAVFRYSDRPAENSAAAGRELGVDSVLEGTVQHDEKTVRVSVRLIKVGDGKTLWAENFNERFSDIFSVQDLISARVAETLSLKLNSRQEQLLADRNTFSTEAFEAFQLGNYFWNRRSKEDLEKSIEYFQMAIKFDPNYARAHGALADSYAMLGYYGFADQNEMSEKTLAAAEKALSLNSESPEPYLALGAMDIFKKKFQPAQIKIERAVALAPYNSSARHRYGVVLLFNGKLNESVAQMRLAQEYDPLSPVINKTLCSSLIFSENYSEAVGYCEIAVRISPETPGSRTLLAYAYFLNKRYDEALNQMHLAAQNKNEAANIPSTLAYYYSKMGRRAEAEKIYAELKNDLEKQSELAVDLTIIGYELGKKNEALKYYEQMLKQNNSNTDFEIIFAYDPMWNDIKNDPNFDKIYRQSTASRQN